MSRGGEGGTCLYYSLGNDNGDDSDTNDGGVWLEHEEQMEEQLQAITVDLAAQSAKGGGQVRQTSTFLSSSAGA